MRRNLATNKMPPAQRTTKLLLKLLVLLAGLFDVQSLSLTKQQQQANTTSEATTQQAANNASLIHELEPHVSIVRSGIQSSESSNSPAPASLESRQDDQQRANNMQANKEQSAPLQVAANHRPMSAASNHQNWPIEPYPSASYTTLSVQPPTGTSSQFLASREHHHEFEDMPAYNQQQMFAGSLASGVALPDALLPSASAPALAPLNAGLIQNLTAGLFPVNKLSNATLSSLSELLARTKHAPQAANNQTAPQHWPTQLASLADGTQPSSSQFNYLEALLGDHRFNPMLDYLNGGAGETHSQFGNSQFGHREPNSILRSQQQQQQQQQHPQQQQHVIGNLANSNLLSHAQRNNHKQLDISPVIVGTHTGGRKSTSNVHNTYLPFKDKNRPVTSQYPPMTNGQMLNMAASLYDNYLDQNYRYPQQQQQQQQQHREVAEQQYQFIQAHQANNQNHLDKVVYHSTPFRPSIVSPPQQQQLRNGTQLVSGQSHQRPKNEADSKSMSYASLASSNSRPTEFAVNSSRVLANKFELPLRQHESDFDSIFDHINQQQAPRTSSQANQTAASNQQQQQLNYSAFGGTERPAQMPQPLSGPQLLLDLYERAIDSQIQEAIYTDHRQHFQHLGPLAAAGPTGAQSSSVSASGSSLPSATSPQAAASVDSQTNWLFDDSPPAAEPNGAAGQLQVAASRQPSGAAVALGHYQQSPTTGYTSAGMDSLASALQELPTFSASDLQPIMPQLAAEPTYSLLPPAGLNVNGHHHHQHHHHQSAQAERFSDASSLVSLAAQLLDQQQLFGAPEITGAELAGATSTAAHLFDSRPSPSSSSLSPSLVLHSAPRPSLQTPKEPTSTNGNGLASLLNKLQASQISSILTSPFAHLYANLPRYRYAAKSKQSAPAATTSATLTSQRQPASPSGLIRQQTAANLIASSGQALTPLQSAMLQAQAATSAYLNSETQLTEQARVQSALVAAETGQLALSSGLAGGGISPLVWRQLLAPINWARKQTSALNSTNFASLYGSQPPTFKTVNQDRTPPTPLTQLNTIWNSNNNNHLPFNQLLATQQQQLASASSPTGMAAASVSSLNGADKRPPARLKIKILKIPVAFYDSSSQTNGGLLTEGAASELHTASSLNLVPVHLQPSPTASLLASLACSLHGPQLQQTSQLSPLFSPGGQVGSAYSLPGGASSAHSFKSLAQRHNHLPFQYHQMEPQEAAGLTRPHTSQLLSSSLMHTNVNPATSAASNADKPAPIRDFTDINQSTDSQLSSSTLSVTDASATAPNKQQQAFMSKSS